MTTLELCASTRFRRARRAVLATALWLFSISTTVLLAGMWGRAVASDNGAIEAGARAALESDVVSGLLTGWIADGIASAAVDLPQGTALSAATAVWEYPETTNVLAAAVDELVAAAFPPPGTSVSVDLATALRPLSSVVIVELEPRGVALTSSTIDAALAEIPEVVVGSVTESGLAGAVAVAAAQDPFRQLRALAIRVALSALTFAILLRLGAWALDPPGGRSPLAAGGSVLLSSNFHVLLGTVFAVSGAAVAATAIVSRCRRLLAV